MVEPTALETTSELEHAGAPAERGLLDHVHEHIAQ
jgi:hypothetical protein